MSEPGRRGFITGALALFAAPVIVKAASLMRVAPTEVIRPRGNSLLTINEITREAVRLFENNNAFLRELDWQYDEQFGAQEAKIGTQLRIWLPADFVVSDGPHLLVQGPDVAYGTINLWDRKPVEPLVPAAAVLGAAAVLAAPEVLVKPVTRRFWSKL